jgi:hypothetical protein
MIQLNVTCHFLFLFWRGKYNLKYVWCLVINFLGLAEIEIGAGQFSFEELCAV